jgi:hypothetical protein
LISLLSFSTISAGVLLGAPMPNQTLDSPSWRLIDSGTFGAIRKFLRLPVTYFTG